MILYRYEKFCCHETLTGWDNENNVEIKLYEFKVTKETKRGFWFLLNRKPKWCSKTSKSPYAVQTKEKALENFKRRMKRSISLSKHNINYCQLALEKLTNINNYDTNRKMQG